MNFEETLRQRSAYAETVLNKYLPVPEGYQGTLLEAMQYSAGAGGKRIRPVLLMESCRLFGGSLKLAEPFMAALEMIHNYSLVHDDLPAMDNDSYRRGKETTWKVYGQGMAVLAGDGLLNYAFEAAFQALEQAQNEAQLRQVSRALCVLGRKAGIYGMIGGQAADIQAQDGGKASGELLDFIHRNKTAALIEAAFMCGAILAGARADEVDAMEKAARGIGIAFQIQDDILDVTSTTEVLGKPTGSDERNGKLTYVSLYGMEKAVEAVRRMSQEAMCLLHSMGEGNVFLEQLVEYLITRKK